MVEDVSEEADVVVHELEHVKLVDERVFFFVLVAVILYLNEIQGDPFVYLTKKANQEDIGHAGD